MVSNDKTSYHEYRTARQGEEALSPYTCRDLNMDEVFEALDETSSCIGRQYLYHALCTDGISEVARHENLIGTLSADTALRSKLVQAIQPLNHQDAYSIPGILAEDGHRYSRRYLLLLQSCRWLPLCCLAGIFLFPYSPVPFLLLLAAYIGNAYLHFKEKNKLMDYFFSVPQLHKLLKICDKLVKEPVFSEVGGVEMKRLPTSLAALQRKLGLFLYHHQRQETGHRKSVPFCRAARCALLRLLTPRAFAVLVSSRFFPGGQTACGRGLSPPD